MNLASGDERHLGIEKSRERAQNAAFRLTAKSQKDEIVPRQNRIDDLRHNRVVVSNDSWENRAALAQPRHQVLTQFVLDAT